jgi:hypothetical protein
VRSIWHTLDYAPIGPTELRLGHDGIAQYGRNIPIIALPGQIWFYTANAFWGWLAFPYNKD